MKRKNIVKTDTTAKIGITHHYYTYRDYLKYVKQIASKLEIDGDALIIDARNHRIFNTLQRPILAIGERPFFKSIILKMLLIFAVSNVECRDNRNKKGSV